MNYSSPFENSPSESEPVTFRLGLELVSSLNVFFGLFERRLSARGLVIGTFL